MKTRNGFVSNSSSSSFVCDVCHTSESGWDASPEDCGMVQCPKGHTFCETHNDGPQIITPIEVVKSELNDDEGWVEYYKGDPGPETDEDWRDAYQDRLSDNGYSITILNCAVCKGTAVREEDLAKFLLLRSEFDSREQAKEAMRKEYPDLDGLHNAYEAYKEFSKNENESGVRK